MYPQFWASDVNVEAYIENILIVGGVEAKRSKANFGKEHEHSNTGYPNMAYGPYNYQKCADASPGKGRAAFTEKRGTSGGKVSRAVTTAS
jgi:hypothetical protein